LPDVEGYIVDFEGSDDPMHPQNWLMKRRYVTFIQCLISWLTVIG
jgi:hypothetical protein